MNALTARNAQTTRKRHANLVTALILASIAALFFVGVIVSRYMGSLETGMGIVGFIALVLLIFAIVRNVRDR